MKRMFYIVFMTSILAACVSCSVEDRAQAFMQKGTDLYQAGRFAKARLEFKNVLQIDAQRADAWLMIAQVEEALENWTAAYKAYARAAELQPTLYEARIKKGALLLASGQPDDALAEANAVLQANGKDPGGLALRASVSLGRQQLDAAAIDAEAAIEQDPHRREALVVLSNIRIAQGRLADARDLLQTAVTHHPNDPALKLYLADIVDDLGDSDSMQRLLEELIDTQPEEFAYRLQLARYLVSKGETKAAEQTLRTAIEARPGDLERRLMLIEFLMETAGFDPAEQQLKTWIADEPENYGLQFALADRYRDAKRSDAAESVYRSVIERDAIGPDGLKARALLANVLLVQGQADAALALSEEVLGEDKQNSDALLVRAAVALQRSQSDQAIGDLRVVLRNAPGSTAAARQLARAHVARDELALAEDTLKIAIENAPKKPAAYLQLAQLRTGSGDLEGASQVLEQLLAQVPGNVMAQAALARIQLTQKDIGALENTAEKVLRTRPEHSFGHYLKGLVLQGRGELEASIVQFEAALEKGPQKAEPLLELARNHLILKQADQAEGWLKQLLADSPNDVRATNLLGQAYTVLGKLRQAREQYESAVRIAPASPIAYGRLARLELAEGDQSGALAIIETGIDATQRNTALVLTLAALAERAGDHQAAIAAYEEVLERHPGAQAVTNNLAMMLAEHRSGDAASLSRARDLVATLESSDNAALLDTAGWVHYRSGNYERAAALLEKARELADLIPERQFHLGMAYLKTGRVEEGTSLLSAALGADSSFPGQEEAKQVLATLAAD